MRQPLDIPTHLIRDAELYAPGRKGADAVSHVLQDYPRLVAEVRQLSRRVTDLDTEGAELDQLLAKLQGIARQILEV